MTFTDKTINTARILIVDDEENNIVVLERLLRQAGYSEIHCTTDSKATIRLHGQLLPDLIFLDLHMPEPNGFELLEQLSQNRTEDVPWVPVLVLTADITPSAKLKALALGANDFLTKPIERCELLLRTRNLLQTRFLQRDLLRQSASLQEMNKRAENLESNLQRVVEHLARTGEYIELETT